MNIWLRGSLTANPYYRTAFSVARVPREVVRHKTLVQLIGQTRKILSADAQAHQIKGEVVRSTEINAAEQILLDPARRVLEELMEHAAENPPLEEVRKAAREATRMMKREEKQASGSDSLKILDLLIPEIVGEFLSAAPCPDPSFGALELESPPPFGIHEEE